MSDKKCNKCGKNIDYDGYHHCIPEELLQPNESDIEQTIRQVKEADQGWKKIPVTNELAKTAAYHYFEMVIEGAIMPIISDRERLKAENAELTRKGESLCNQNGALLIEQHDFKKAKTELLSALKNLSKKARETHLNKKDQVFADFVVEIAQEAITKHSTEGENNDISQI